MIKTQTTSESKFLRRILPHYYNYVVDNPSTYLPRFYGMHRVDMPHLGTRVHFVVMHSVFDAGDLPVGIKFDLKGSSVGREATEEEKSRGPDRCVFKDNDLVAQGRRIRLGPSRKRIFVEQLRKDCEFLRRMKAMDYSLLLGVASPHARRSHREDEEDEYEEGEEEEDEYAQRHNAPNGYDRGAGALAPRTRTALAADANAHANIAPAGRAAPPPPHRRRASRPTGPEDVSSSGATSDSSVEDSARAPRDASDFPPHAPRAHRTGEESDENSGPVYEFVPGPAAADAVADGAARGGGRRASVDGHTIQVPPDVAPASCAPVPAAVAPGEEVDEVYFFGIIDILQQYNVRKTVETVFRSLLHPRHGISAVPPLEYAARFLSFIETNCE
jgi:1-phosphatidylinositol-4-phosphate 5-kinase